ncbi:CRISPR-associated endonuclease Cas2 [Stieleria varia]|uniref:CRISPR-associated endoribonuclease Cas2 n=1 Tax=Stieleria varia TaxID=2528005 RepID=A0A5C6AS27_9BACT|nr:CRISPR-associated endonuclease Cas2 [Stieleria varia]TWU02795.1 CRISPR-associated endoribonuclease Cas2 [Stieleria varia]
MIHLVMYDISDDKTRRRIADRLADLGLIRTQFSVFVGTIEPNRVDELALFAEESLEEQDRLYILPMTRENLANSRQVGRGIDEQLVANETLTQVI